MALGDGIARNKGRKGYAFQKGYNTAIDEFAERLQEKVESFQTKINGFKADVLTLDYFVEFVDEIAEQMKGGAE